VSDTDAASTTDSRRGGDHMTLTEHLAELRMRIIRGALAILIGAIVVLAFYNTVLGWLLEPYAKLCARKPDGFCGESFDSKTGEVSLFALDPIEGLTTRLKISFYGGFMLALPVVLWQLWRFIVPALHKNEKRYALSFVLSSVFLFLLGAAIAFTTLEKALEFLISWAGEDVLPQFQVQAYVRLVVLMMIAFGVGFILPVLLVCLELIGVVTPRRLLGAWRYAVIGIVFAAAAITPSGDPISLIALSVPMIVLYFVAILVGWIVLRGRRKRAAREANHGAT
jgi:sec-independent protein translocase protein TatC